MMAVDVEDVDSANRRGSVGTGTRRFPVWGVVLLTTAAVFIHTPNNLVQGAGIDKPVDCVDVQHGGETASGVYTVYPHGQPREVYCDLTTGSEGWLVFLRRQDGSVDFNKNWSSYKDGFGDVNGEFWLGNELIHELTKSRNVSLRVDMESFEGETGFAEYDVFSVGDEASAYTLHVAGFLPGSTASDSLALPGWHSGVKFATPDRDSPGSNCTKLYGGSWWYTNCFISKLTGTYLRPGHFEFGKGIHWHSWHEEYIMSLKRAEMKLKMTRTAPLKVTPVVDFEAAFSLSDLDNETCMRLGAGYVFSPETRKWTQPIVGRCWLPGVTIETRGHGNGTHSFTVTVVGRRISCDAQGLEVIMKHTDGQDCGLRGSFHRCRLTSATVSSDQLNTCVASCQCRVPKCNSPTVRFVTFREDSEVCEISVE